MILKDSLDFQESVAPLASVAISGALIVHQDFPGVPRLVALSGPERHDIPFSETPTPRLARAFPEGLNSAAGRIVETILPLDHGPIVLVLENDDGSFSRVLRVIDLPDLSRARHVQLAMRYARLAGGQRHFGAFRRLNRLLTLAPDSPETLKARIVLLLAHGAFVRRAAGMMRQLRSHYAANDEPEHFAAFERTLASLGLRHPAPHGGQDTFEDADAAAIWRDLDDLTGQLTRLGLTTFLNSGTLLGAVREGDFIRHDDDIDLAVVLNATSTETAAAEFLKIGHDLRRAGLLAPPEEQTPGSWKLPSIRGVHIDLFPAWFDTGGRLSVYPYSAAQLSRQDLLPLKPWANTRHLAIPRSPDAVLTANYGKDWRIPDPYFRFDFAGAKRAFADFLGALSQADHAPHQPRRRLAEAR